jgi:AraC family transcriptional regulator, positive regulator of tynA and feaB
MRAAGRLVRAWRKRLRYVCSSTLFGRLTKVADPLRPIPTCSWQSIDLLGALFAPSDPSPVSRHADKLFARIRGVVKDGFADPDFGPREVAAVAGISLRYLQKLFTAHGSTCSELIYSLRLDHAARLLHRRASLGTSQPLSEIAYACGFRDYTHFARKFRQRFGHSPGAAARDAVALATP